LTAAAIVITFETWEKSKSFGVSKSGLALAGAERGGSCWGGQEGRCDVTVSPKRKCCWRLNNKKNVGGGVMGLEKHLTGWGKIMGSWKAGNQIGRKGVKCSWGI